MTHEVAPGVLRFAARTPTLLPATHTNSYALVGNSGLLLVEPATPFADEQAAFLAWARGLGQPIQAIVCTHHHQDHVGGAAEFSRRLAAPLWAHARTAQLLPDLAFLRHLADGEQLGRWRVLFTPGHASGHICLYDADDGTLVVGDMVASLGTILIPPDDGDMGEYLRQLERLAALEARVALPAHGEPITDPSRLFRGYVTHRLARAAKIVHALSARQKAVTLEALLPLVYDDVQPEALPFALLSLRAHVDKLARDGRVLENAAGISWNP